jgi:hypothetical protein
MRDQLEDHADTAARQVAPTTNGWSDRTTWSPGHLHNSPQTLTIVRNATRIPTPAAIAHDL